MLVFSTIYESQYDRLRRAAMSPSQCGNGLSCGVSRRLASEEKQGCVAIQQPLNRYP
jgi:hypothetical protein